MAPARRSRPWTAVHDGLFRHGRHVFVYNNVRTNQVLYSLTRALENDAVKQLSYFGKKTVPPTVRRDMWQPLLTISFPHGQEQQGLLVYQRLREYRRFRDVNWKQRKDLLVHEAFAKTRLKPDEDGKPRDIWKERRKILMDQKAEAVADVAAILERQYKIRREVKATLASKKNKRLQLKQNKLNKLKKEAQEGKIQRLEINIRNLKDALARGKGKNPGKNAPKTEEEQKKWEEYQRKEIERLNWKKGELRRALKSAEEAKGVSADTTGNLMNGKATSSVGVSTRKSAKRGVRASVKVEQAKQRAEKKAETVQQSSGKWLSLDKLAFWRASKVTREPANEAAKKSEKTRSQDDAVYGPHIRQRTKRLKELWSLRYKGPPKNLKTKGDKRRWNDDLSSIISQVHTELQLIAKHRKEGSLPAFIQESSRKVQIHWLDVEDALYASTWPTHVIHNTMGRIERFKAPIPGGKIRYPLGQRLAPELSDEEVKHMEENVRLDGEANEEGGKDEDEQQEKSPEQKLDKENAKRDRESKEGVEDQKAKDGKKTGMLPFLAGGGPKDIRDSLRP